MDRPSSVMERAITMREINKFRLDAPHVIPEGLAGLIRQEVCSHFKYHKVL